ncbi:choline dehydrogenase-like flavoprotein [Mycobacterium frederiksbergense]|uniref:Choline dehydrogenase-like flavoprotein n=1 Tax=Mycolicibacterium frederiksbergense TaxID=117567 RepID=A0ABT6KZS9_9MYCO|nr:GMC family oxidoreductase [Mycolicibacterium frederiksbergense]MDH6196207.1 choline dehydrogenase-like flavoprotein [Mycolicibacterium frederiksbergense]
MSSSEWTFDAIVVGSGATGSWAAKELTECGLSVVVLEAGRNLDLTRDFPTDAAVGAMGMASRAKAALYGQPVQARCAAFYESTKHLYVDDRKNPYTTPAGKRFLWYRGRQLGGRLHTWSRHVPRMSNHEFKSASLRGNGIDWPLSYEDLAPYYDVVERTLGVHGSPADIPNCPDGQFIGPAKTTKIEEKFLTNIAQRLPNVRATHGRTVKYDKERIPLPLRLAMGTGRLRIRTDAVVRRLLVDERSGKAAGVEFVDRTTMNTEAVYGKIVVLCASAIESVRILLNSKSSRHPSGVGGSSGHLGRYVCDHIAYAQSGSVRAEDAEPNPSEDGFDFAATGVYIPSFCETESAIFPGGYGIQIGIGRGKPTWSMYALGEMQPRYENCVSLDPNVKDAWGIPVARIECSHSQDEMKMVAHMKRMIPEIAAAGGLPIDKNHDLGRGNMIFRMLRSRIFTDYGAYWPGAAVHESGGARMGDKPDNSVLNPYCQCWDADNVFVTDGACFVSPGFQNHTLTMMALTVRTCQFIARDYLKH